MESGAKRVECGSGSTERGADRSGQAKARGNEGVEGSLTSRRKANAGATLYLVRHSLLSSLRILYCRECFCPPIRAKVPSVQAAPPLASPSWRAGCTTFTGLFNPEHIDIMEKQKAEHVASLACSGSPLIRTEVNLNGR